MEYEKVLIGWKNYEEVLKQWKVLAKEDIVVLELFLLDIRKNFKRCCFTEIAMWCK